MENELDDRYEEEVSTRISPRKLIYSSDSAMSLSDILSVTEGLDPSKVVIDIDFEVPDWTALIIYIQD